MKAISIDPFAKRIQEIELQRDEQGDITEDLCQAINCQWAEAVMSFPNGDHLYVNGEGSEEADNLAFSIVVNGICVPFLGCGIIVGMDMAHDIEVDTHFTSDYIKPLVRFYDLPESLLIKTKDITVLPKP
jgi:hypothetical protein